MERTSEKHRPVIRVLICTVEGESARKTVENRDRLVGLRKLLDAVAKENVDLILLPGGYFFSETAFPNQQNPKQIPMLKEIWAAIKDKEIAVCFGVDTCRNGTSVKKAHKTYLLSSSYGFAWTPTDKYCGPWRQRSKNRLDQREMPQDLAKEKRFIHVGARRVALLMCGELFNPKLREAALAQGVTVVVNAVHAGRGFRFDGAAKLLSSAGSITSVLMSCHVARKGAMKRCYIMGNRESRREITVKVDEPIRIEGFVVSVPQTGEGSLRRFLVGEEFGGADTTS